MQAETNGKFDLYSQYQPKALYFKESDIVEYVRKDAPCVHERIDEALTLVLDLYSNKPIGFTLKGFKNLYWKHLKPKYNITENEFLNLTVALEEALGLLGDEVFGDRRKAYDSALEIAHRDSVRLQEDELENVA